MRVVRSTTYVPVERTLKQAIKEKMKVLREFYVVDKNNQEEIEMKLRAAVEAEPDKNFDIILDRVAHTMIEQKLNSVK